MSLVACVQIPNLPIALARSDDVTLAAVPLVLYDIERERALVYAASEDSGVAVGMPLHRARVRCPRAVYLPAEPGRSAAAGAALAALLGVFSPRVAEVASLPDRALALDLGPIALSQAIALVERIASRVRAELGLVAAIGLGMTPLVARHAARRAGAGAAVLVPSGQEQAFLAPQPIETLELEGELVARLAGLGLRTAGDLARVPLDALQVQFGAAGQQLYLLARGIDPTLIPTTIDVPTISFRRRFAGPLLDRLLLERVITGLAGRLSARLLADGASAGAVRLSLTLEDGAPVLLERTLTEPTSDAARLAAALLGLGRSADVDSGVTALMVSASHLAPVVVEQLELFAPAGGQEARLQEVLGRLNARYAGSLLRARLVSETERLPERRVRLEPR